MSTHVVGFKPPDDKWKAMKSVWDVCRSAGVSIPDEVDEFFDGCTPDNDGVVIELGTSYGSLTHESVSRFSEDGEQGFQVDIGKLPKDIKILRFYNSF